MFSPNGPAAVRNGNRRVLTAGGLGPQDGVDDLITALAAVSCTELVVAGGRDKSELPGDADFQRLRELADRHGVADRVSFLGRVPHSDMPALIRSADVVACPQSGATSGVVSLEAMACGVPVVAARSVVSPSPWCTA